MANRITAADLERIVERINAIAGMPATPYSPPDETGRPRANPGNFHLEWAYGGARLCRMSLTGGSGTSDITGRVTRREMYHLLHAYRDGLWLGLELAARREETP